MGSNLPQTNTRTDHAMVIRANNTVVGHIQEWTPQQSLTITAVYQLGQLPNGITSGSVVENVPGNIGGLTIGVNRFDLYVDRMEDVWGMGIKGAITMLTDQYKPFEVIERWSMTDELGSVLGTESWIYKGCWFNSLGRTHSAQGDRITKVNASITYAAKVIL